MTTTSVPVFDAKRTTELLDYTEMVNELEIACTELADGMILAPERQALRFSQQGTMISMPATASDIGIHKLVNVMPDNAERQLPTICGIVSVYDGVTGRPLCVLDGPTVTARRTAALSMLGLTVFRPEPEHVAIIGTGVQAQSHTAALASLYPGVRVSIIGRHLAQAREFVDTHRPVDLDIDAAEHVPEHADTIITVTSSTTPVYNESARVGRLIVAVGAFRPDMAEIGPATLHQSQLFIDEPVSARQEAGDYLQADVDWDSVIPLVDALHNGFDTQQPVVYKTVGCGAWDLAVARAALKRLDVQ